MSGINVNAETVYDDSYYSYNPVEYYGIADMLVSSDSNNNSPFINSSDNSNSLNFESFSTFFDSFVENNPSIYFQRFDSYLLYSDNSNSFYYASIPYGSFIVGYRDYNISVGDYGWCYFNLFVPHDFRSQLGGPWSASYSGGDSFGGGGRINTSTTKNIDGALYDIYDYGLVNNYFVVSTDVPIYVGNNDLVSSFDEISDLGNNVNNGGSSRSEELKKHLTLYDNSALYISASSFNNGTLYIYPIMDDYQKNNSEDFSLVLSGSASYVCYKNTEGDVNLKYEGQSVNKMYGIGLNSTSISSSCNIEIPFSDIVGSYYAISMNDLNKEFPTSSDYSLMPLAFCLSTNYSSYIATFSRFVSSFTVSGFKLDTTNLVNNSYDCIPTDCLYHFDVYVKNSDGDISGSLLNFDADFINGTYSNNFSNLSNLEDIENDIQGDSDYLPSDYFYNNDLPSYNTDVSYGGSSSNSSANNDLYNNNNINFPSGDSGGGAIGGTSTSYGDNAVTVNTGGVNQNVSITSENSATKYFPTLVNKLLPDKNGDGGLSENVEGLVNSNGWLSAMKETYSFVPSYVFDALGTFFVACITILACGFLLRILLDLL